MSEDLPTWEEDGEDLEGHDGNGNPVCVSIQYLNLDGGGDLPLRRDEVSVDWLHTGHV